MAGGLSEWVESLQSRIIALEASVASLKAWRSWVLGAAFGIGVAAGSLGPATLHKLMGQ